MASSPSKRGKITQVHLDEAASLSAIWNSERGKSSRAQAEAMSQEAFGHRFGIGNQAAVGFFLNGKTALSPKAAAGFARGLGCSVAEFSPRLAAVLSAPVDPPDWPFDRVDRARWDACNDVDRGYIQATINKALDECEAARAKAHPGIKAVSTSVDGPGSPVAGAKIGDGEVRASREKKRNERHHD